GYYVTYIPFDRFLHQLLMPAPVFRRTLSSAGIILTKNRHVLTSHAKMILNIRVQSFHRLLALYLRTTLQQWSQYPFRFISATMVLYFLFCSSSLTLAFVIILLSSLTDAVSFFSIASLSGS